MGLELGWPDGVLAARWPWELALSQAANLTALKKKKAPRSLAGCPQWAVGGAWQELATGVQDGVRRAQQCPGVGGYPAPAGKGGVSHVTVLMI